MEEEETAPWRRTQRDERKAILTSEYAGAEVAENRVERWSLSLFRSRGRPTMRLLMEDFHMAVSHVKAGMP